MYSNLNENIILTYCHSREGGNPVILIVSLNILRVSFRISKRSVPYKMTHTVVFHVFYFGFSGFPPTRE